MKTEPVYAELVKTLADRAIRAYLQAEDQLVVSRQPGAPWPNAGNSFWVSFKVQHWYLCTWAPRCYRIPSDADLAGLIERFVDYGTSAQGTVPPELVEGFGLTELSLEETEPLFGWSGSEHESNA